MKTDNHEVIFAIVNSGYAEDVMEVAKEQGARGWHSSLASVGGRPRSSEGLGTIQVHGSAISQTSL